MDIASVISQVEDALFPKLALTIWERAVYYYLFRQTWITGQDKTLVTVEGIALGLGISDFKAREVLRSLHSKGCIKIQDKSRKGHEVRVFLPSEINLPQDPVAPPLDLESVDFYSGRQYLDALIVRENNECFYCLRQVARENCELDHLNPLAGGTDHSYRNVVVSCHECNKLKQDKRGEDYLRALFRRNLLSDADLEDRMRAVEALRSGQLVPKL